MSATFELLFLPPRGPDDDAVAHVCLTAETPHGYDDKHTLVTPPATSVADLDYPGQHVARRTGADSGRGPEQVFRAVMARMIRGLEPAVGELTPASGLLVQDDDDEDDEEDDGKDDEDEEEDDDDSPPPGWSD